MTWPRWITCPHCGEKRDAGGRYTSPANAELDRRWWADAHESGECAMSLEDAPGEARGG